MVATSTARTVPSLQRGSPADPSAGSGRFTMEVRPSADRIVLRIAGELDAKVAPRFRAAIDELSWSGDLVVDAAELSFIDSTGIGCLLKLHHRADDAGGILILTGCRPGVRRPIEATGLHRVIALVDHLT